MTQSEIDLLIKDLCTRLPYGTKYEIDGFKPNVKCRNGKLDDNVWNAISLIIDTESEYHELCHIKHINPDGIIYHNYVHFSRLKPYLFPLSSMTKEQKVEFDKMAELDSEYIITQVKNDAPNWTSGLNRFNWLLKNHFDVCGLIPMSLANDATGLNIY